MNDFRHRDTDTPVFVFNDYDYDDDDDDMSGREAHVTCLGARGSLVSGI